MATLKATVNKKLKSGMYVVYIRVTQNRKKSYIRTFWLVDDKGLSRDKKVITDPYVIEQTSEMIEQFYQRLNRINTKNWSASEVVQYLLSGNADVSFSDTTEKRAMPASRIRQFFKVVPESSRYKHPLMELGQDVAMMSFCMCGINAIDLFNATKDQYKDGIFHYERQKTRNARSDKGYF